MTFLMYHIMFLPLPQNNASSPELWNTVFTFVLWMVPFGAAYIWHVYHDHKHNHHTDKKLDEITDLLKKLLEKK